MTQKHYDGKTINNTINNTATSSDMLTVAAICKTLAAGVLAFAAIKSSKSSKSSHAKLAACIKVQQDDASIIVAQSAAGSPLRLALKAARAERVTIIKSGETVYAPGVIDAARDIVTMIDNTIKALETIKAHADMIVPMHTCAVAA
jgi:hypothetical protein